MIVVFSPYPYEPLRKDGMYRRILEIDEHLLKDEERVYVYYTPQGDDYRITPPFLVDTNAEVQLLDLQYISHQLKLRDLINKADFVYAQTMIYSSPYLSAFYSSGKIITDAHGIAGEEEKLVERFSRAKLIGAFEAEAATSSRAVVVVTKAMAEYFKKAYGANDTMYIHVPVCTLGISELELQSKDEKLVIYSGGIHKWQNIPDMLALAKKCSQYDFLFLTNSVSELKEEAKKIGVLDSITVRSVEYEQVFDELKRATYGLLLRDDTPVNNVAFPTKLIEYLACGVIPVVKTINVGDLLEMGVRYVTLQDFEDGKLPSQDELVSMAKHNFKCYLSVFSSFQSGLSELRKVIEDIRETAPHYVNDTIALPSSYRMTFLPIQSELKAVTAEGIQTFSIDCGETPAVITKDFEKPLHCKELHFILSNKKFVFDKANLIVYLVDGGEIVIKPSNLLSFRKDKFDNFIALSDNKFIFKLPVQTRIKRVELIINFMLYGPEVGNYQDEKTTTLKQRESLIKKFFFSLRNESPFTTGKRIIKYIKKTTLSK